ncbi:MAG: hypothetical protein AAGE59_16760 [Cyanobacteria bacterium P01_F01_bin.86]
MKSTADRPSLGSAVVNDTLIIDLDSEGWSHRHYCGALQPDSHHPNYRSQLIQRAIVGCYETATRSPTTPHSW